MKLSQTIGKYDGIWSWVNRPALLAMLVVASLAIYLTAGQPQSASADSGIVAQQMIADAVINQADGDAAEDATDEGAADNDAAPETETETEEEEEEPSKMDAVYSAMDSDR
ncbi:MAG: hypothetical protein AAFN70_04675, partial [Planctomycetota bacterium]